MKNINIINNILRSKSGDKRGTLNSLYLPKIKIDKSEKL